MDWRLGMGGVWSAVLLLWCDLQSRAAPRAQHQRAEVDLKAKALGLCREGAQSKAEKMLEPTPEVLYNLRVLHPSRVEDWPPQPARQECRYSDKQIQEAIEVAIDSFPPPSVGCWAVGAETFTP